MVKTDTPHPKRIKRESDKHVYAALDEAADDAESMERNVNLLKKEISKPKPKLT